ncbi:hypothetical protein [Streptomyces sp. NPDC017991]
MTGTGAGRAVRVGTVGGARTERDTGGSSGPGASFGPVRPGGARDSGA